MLTRRSFMATAGGGVVAASSGLSTLADDFPSRAIRIVVPFAPGAAIDVTARLLQQPLTAAFGQSVVIENRPGATGMIGASYVAQAAPDGYTLLYMPGSGLALRKFVSKVPVPDLLTDFTPIATTVELASFIVVGGHTSIKSLQDLIDYSSKNPGKLNYGSAGVNSTQHIVGELLVRHGVKMVNVPFQGIAPAMTALLGGQVDVGIFDLATIKASMKDDNIRILAVASPKRHAGAPDIPTVSETLSGFEMPTFWIGIFGPKGMAASLVSRLNAEVTKALDSPEVKEKLLSQNYAIIPNSPEGVAKLARDSVEAHRRVAELAKLTPQ